MPDAMLQFGPTKIFVAQVLPLQLQVYTRLHVQYRFYDLLLCNASYGQHPCSSNSPLSLHSTTSEYITITKITINKFCYTIHKLKTR